MMTWLNKIYHSLRKKAKKNNVKTTEATTSLGGAEDPVQKGRRIAETNRLAREAAMASRKETIRLTECHGLKFTYTSTHTIAYRVGRIQSQDKETGTLGRVVTFATAILNPDDNGNRQHGRDLTVRRFHRGATVSLKAPSDFRDGDEFIRALATYMLEEDGPVAGAIRDTCEPGFFSH